jgi:hypothetical protein
MLKLIHVAEVSAIEVRIFARLLASISRLLRLLAQLLFGSSHSTTQPAVKSQVS